MARAQRILDLPSDAAKIKYSSMRPQSGKLIVDLDGTLFVLYRFENVNQLNRLERVLRKAADAGVNLQGLVSRSFTSSEYRDHGFWLALSFLPGEIMVTETPLPVNLASLGRNLARLHSIKGPRWCSLLQKKHPQLPHEIFLKKKSMQEDRRRWVLESHARLKGLRSFQLTHGDLFGTNVLLLQDGSVALIDYEMLAYEPAGMELALALLRPFCKERESRRLIFDAYMKDCTDEVAVNWEIHGRDFIFSTAARLARTRVKRIHKLKSRINAMDEELLTLPPESQRDTLAMARDAHLYDLDLAERMLIRWWHVAHTAIKPSLASSGVDPLDIRDHSYRALEIKYPSLDASNGFVPPPLDQWRRKLNELPKPCTPEKVMMEAGPLCGVRQECRMPRRMESASEWQCQERACAEFVCLS